MATVASHYLQAALACAERGGHNRQPLLARLGIGPEQLLQPRVPAEQMARLVQAVWVLLEDEFMGCTARPCKPGVFALMARQVLHQQTLEEMLRHGVEFYNLFSDDIAMQLRRRNGRAELEVVFSHSERDPDCFYREFWLLIWHRFSSWLIGHSIALQQVSFPYPPPAHQPELSDLFPCKHRFNQPSLKLSFSADYLDKSSVRTPRDLAHFLRDSPAGLMTIGDDELSYRARIRRDLLPPVKGVLRLPSFEVLAQGYGLSRQTLRRRLKSEASSYPQIKAEMRLDLAIEKLRIERLTIAEIALQLGFSESRAFTRAFRQWTGLSPSDFRGQISVAGVGVTPRATG
ncbi:MAG: AraC-like DNA-binding protein [Motiliproteus sp.]|jgi:AraC-like DNA-binding protein